MYTPFHFKNTNIEEVKEFIKANGFGILVSHNGGAPWATHIPLLMEIDNDNQTILSGHISIANKQAEHFTSGARVLAIFSGPHAYISSSWYDHENVPTWNYIAVHVYGTIRIIEGDRLWQKLSSMVDKYEGERPNAVKLANMSSDYVDAQIRGIIGFEINVDDIQASYKMSQNRDEKNYSAIIHHLDSQEDNKSKAFAEEMKKIYDAKFVK